MGKGHPCPKTESVVVDVCRWLVADTIIDPVMGSATTGAACVRLGKSFVGIEKDPVYFDIACERIRRAYEQPRLPGLEPEREKQGELL